MEQHTINDSHHLDNNDYIALNDSARSSASNTKHTTINNNNNCNNNNNNNNNNRASEASPTHNKRVKRVTCFTSRGCSPREVPCASDPNPEYGFRFRFISGAAHNNQQSPREESKRKGHSQMGGRDNDVVVATSGGHGRVVACRRHGLPVSGG